MQKYSEYKTGKKEKIVFFVIAFLIVVVLFMSAMAQNAVYKSRQDEAYTVITEKAYKWVETDSAPTGKVKEYHFTLPQIGRADALAFYINHHNIEVYLEEECVYSVSETGQRFRTTGGVYAMIPLYESDSGKAVRVVLTPLYDNYQDEPEFITGSELAIYKAAFIKAMPELILSLCTVFSGLFLLCLAIYHNIRRYPVCRLYAIGLLAVSAGVWRFTYGSFAYLLFAEHSVFIYTLSVVSLMTIALSMLGCVELPEDERVVKKLVRYGALVYGVTYMIELVLQLFGIVDLRQLLQAVHVTIVMSAAALLWGGMVSWFGRKFRPDRPRIRSYSWLIGVGAIIDLILYYYSADSVGMLYSLVAIICFSMLESIKIIISFSEQKNALEEMEVRLALSRTTTMMSQIRSHFVFNLLNAISGMCKYDPEKADDTVVRFARYLRNNIDIMEDDKNIPFITDLKQLEDYVALEQVRFGDKIEFYTDIEAVDFMIPPLILQPVVENAIKHGVSRKQTNGTIILRTRDMGDSIVITVEDDGVGFDTQKPANDKSVGLKNIRFRLKHLVNGTLDITSRINKGTTVTITIPKEGRQEA